MAGDLRPGWREIAGTCQLQVRPGKGQGRLNWISPRCKIDLEGRLFGDHGPLAQNPQRARGHQDRQPGAVGGEGWVQPEPLEGVLDLA